MAARPLNDTNELIEILDDLAALQAIVWAVAQTKRPPPSPDLSLFPPLKAIDHSILRDPHFASLSNKLLGCFLRLLPSNIQPFVLSGSLTSELKLQYLCTSSAHLLPWHLPMDHTSHMILTIESAKSHMSMILTALPLLTLLSDILVVTSGIMNFRPQQQKIRRFSLICDDLRHLTAQTSGPAACIDSTCSVPLDSGPFKTEGIATESYPFDSLVLKAVAEFLSLFGSPPPFTCSCLSLSSFANQEQVDNIPISLPCGYAGFGDDDTEVNSQQRQEINEISHVVTKAPTIRRALLYAAHDYGPRFDSVGDVPICNVDVLGGILSNDNYEVAVKKNWSSVSARNAISGFAKAKIQGFVKPTDLLVIYFCGHVVLDPIPYLTIGGEHRIGPEADPDAVEDRRFGLEDFFQLFSHQYPCNIVFILDCCFSGQQEIFERVFKNRKAPPRNVALLPSARSTTKAFVSLQIDKIPTGSWVPDYWGCSPFTSALVRAYLGDALTPRAADFHQSRSFLLTWKELYKSASEIMTCTLKYFQKANLHTKITDFRVFMLEEPHVLSGSYYHLYRAVTPLLPVCFAESNRFVSSYLDKIAKEVTSLFLHFDSNVQSKLPKHIRSVLLHTDNRILVPSVFKIIFPANASPLFDSLNIGLSAILPEDPTGDMIEKIMRIMLNRTTDLILELVASFKANQIGALTASYEESPLRLLSDPIKGPGGDGR